MEVFTMAQQSKREYLRSIYHRYHQAERSERSMILEEFTRVCGYHRKHALRLLNGPLPSKKPQRVPTPRPPTYSERMIRILAKIWAASGYLCSQRLKAALPHWLPWAKERFRLASESQRQMLRISPRQMDRRLQSYKRTVKRRIYGTTRPGSLLKQMIPVKTDHWDVTRPGYLEIDLVSHSGASGAGDFLQTLDCVDIQTSWVERKAVLGKGQAAILEAMTHIERNLPFPLKGIDSDNGSEFINHHLFAFCQRPEGSSIQFTRSRAYKKDDNAHVEQKNWTHVRKLLGWDRYDSPQALRAINALYDDLRLFQNLFQPSMKLLLKVRKGSRLIRRYDTPQTPLQRVCRCKEADPRRVQALKRLARTLDPFELSQRIDQKLQRIFRLAHRSGTAPRALPPSKPSRMNPPATSNGYPKRSLPQKTQTPWRGWTFSRRLKQHNREMNRSLKKVA